MFIGHFALGLAAKKLDFKPSIGTYFLATQFIDLLWPFLLLAGLEKVEVDPGNTEFTPLNFISYPYSHSLAAVAVWALVVSLVYYLVKRNMRGALVIAALVLSHWFLDLLTHRPDLPVTPWSDHKVGLGLWNQKIVTLIVEISMFLIGAFIYSRITAPKKKLGTIAFYSFVIFLLAVYFMNAFGPPPSSADDIPYVGFSLWLLVAWGYWIDRLRHPAQSRK